jgi:hypothetical protein
MEALDPRSFPPPVAAACGTCGWRNSGVDPAALPDSIAELLERTPTVLVRTLSSSREYGGGIQCLWLPHIVVYCILAFIRPA